MNYHQKDSAILKECAKGSTEAFGIIVRKYQGYVCAITFSATGNRDQSEELAQDVFVLAWQNLSKLKDRSKFRSWLYAIARNRIRQHYRNAERDLLNKAEPIEAAESTGCTNGPLDDLISKEHRLLVKQALESMPENYRVPLVLFYREGKSVRQVSELLDLSVDAAKKRISRGRRMLESARESIFENVAVATAPAQTFVGCVIGAIALGDLACSSASGAATAVPTIGHTSSFLSGTLLSKTAAIITIGIISLGLTGMAINNYAQKASAKPSREVVTNLGPSLNKGLVMHLGFDDIEYRADGWWTADTSENTNDGRVYGGKLVDGIIGKAIKLDSTSEPEFVTVADDDTLDADIVTICAWIKTDHKDDFWNRILDKGWDTAYNLCIGGEFKKVRHSSQLYIECMGISLDSKQEVVDSKWHFVTATFDGSSMSLFIDGKLDNKTKLKKPMSLKHNDVDIHIGKLAVPEKPPYDKAYFNGMIDELRLYNRVLSNWEIAQLYRYQPDDLTQKKLKIKKVAKK